MTVTAQAETREFQTEVRQLLQLMIHSLYSNKEIFIRELISNASDASDKLRFNALQDDALYEGDAELSVKVTVDKDNKTVTIADNGIGMTRDDVIEHLGTIAKSGTRQFFESLTGDESNDAKMIGQFGVGFYSSFIVADKVTVKSRAAGVDASEGVVWESAGEGSYTLDTIDMPQRGTEITLHLKEGEEEFLESTRLRTIICKYSDHISLPVLMASEKEEDEEKVGEFEAVNHASALWARRKTEITDEEYESFYKHVGHDFEAPLAHVHSHVEGRQSFISLLYIPQRAPFDMWDREQRHGLKLYVRRVFVMEGAKELMPDYLRFVRGVIDSDDLPLNVSREILQRNKQIDSMRGASIKKVLGLLEGMSKNEADDYAKFWKEFGCVLKEGIVEDQANKARISPLIRFASTQNETDIQDVSFAEYIGRMKEGQDKIYYITADSYAAAKNSPHLEVYREKGIEVLLLTDRVDEWMLSALTESDGKQLKSVTKGDLDLGEMEDEAEKEALDKSADEFKDIVEKMQAVLGDSVKEVRTTHRLTGSPSCLVVEENEMALNLQKMLEAAGQVIPESKPILEINPTHPLIARLKAEENEQHFSDLTSILFDQAMLSEGWQLKDPTAFVNRLNGFILSIS